jgi:hypothetical protein
MGLGGELPADSTMCTSCPLLMFAETVRPLVLDPAPVKVLLDTVMGMAVTGTGHAVKPYAPDGKMTGLPG